MRSQPTSNGHVTPAGGSPARVLVAEDDAEMRRYLGEALVRDGHEVSLVVDARELRTQLRTASDIDLVITDVRMPGGTGLDVIAELRARDGETRVLVITAFGDREVRETATRLGAAVLDKPFDAERLRSAVRQLLREGEGEPR